jgi:hypothetical protein
MRSGVVKREARSALLSPIEFVLRAFVQIDRLLVNNVQMSILIKVIYSLAIERAIALESKEMAV